MYLARPMYKVCTCFYHVVVCTLVHSLLVIVRVIFSCITLQWEQLNNFHARYYHPSNSRYACELHVYVLC